MGAEEGSEGVEEGKDVRGMAGMRRVEGWGEDGGDDETVDGLRAGGEQGVAE